jgi:predicted dinucleotide-binding enzyme
MNIGVIGAGNVGGALGTSWAKAGHQVKFGVREPADPKHRAVLEACGRNATAGPTAEAAAFGEVLALATPWDATQAALSTCGSLKDKVLVDCTNPLKFTPAAGLELALVQKMGTGFTWAMLERVQASARGRK